MAIVADSNGIILSSALKVGPEVEVTIPENVKDLNTTWFKQVLGKSTVFYTRRSDGYVYRI